MRDRFVGLAIRLGAQSHEQLRNRDAYRALASRNTMFLHLHTSVTAMLRRHISIDVARMSGQDAQASEQLLLQHRALCDPICGRRLEAARTAMHAHIDYVRGHFERGGDISEIGWAASVRRPRAGRQRPAPHRRAAAMRVVRLTGSSAAH